MTEPQPQVILEHQPVPLCPYCGEEVTDSPAEDLHAARPDEWQVLEWLRPPDAPKET